MATNVINIRRFVDVTTGVQQTPANVTRDWGAYLFVQKATDDQVQKPKRYDNLAQLVLEHSNDEATKAAQVFFGTSYNGVTPTSPIYVAIVPEDSFNENFTNFMADESFYMIGLDSGFEDTVRKAAAGIVEATSKDAAHLLIVEDYSADAANKKLADDTNSLSAFCKTKNYVHTVCAWVNPNNTEKYYGAGLASFFATRTFDNSNRRMASVAHKVAQGISPVDFTDSAITVTATEAFDNLDSKNCNVYANIKIVGLPAWERGNLPSGDDISDYVSADYLNYTISISVFNALQINPRIPMNSDGASILANAISIAFNRLNAAGVIAGGVSLDGETFPDTGYKLSIPLPTGVAKANGLWEYINCSALLAGSCKKVVIGNVLEH